MPCCTNQTQVESLYYNKDVVGTAKKCDLQFLNLSLCIEYLDLI